MSHLTIAEQYSYLQKCTIEEEELLAQISLNITVASHVYAVLDNAVALGKYENGAIRLGLHRSVFTLNTCKYVQELRVFHPEFEFRAIRVDGTFRCRYLIDNRSVDGKVLSIMEETHKLWGSARQGADGNGWSLLQSDRGTQLYFPGSVEAHGEKGIVVRSYIEFYEQKPADHPDEDCEGNLYKFVDERFVKFINWPPESGVKEEDDHGKVG